MAPLQAGAIALTVVNVLMAGYALVAPGLRATIRGPRPADEVSPAPRC